MIEISRDEIRLQSARCLASGSFKSAPRCEPIATGVDRDEGMPELGAGEPSRLWFDALEQSIAKVLARNRQTSVDWVPLQLSAAKVIVGDELCRLWLTSPPLNATRPGDCEAAAMFRFESLFGLDAERWCVSADWDAHQSFLSAALPVALVDGVCAALMSHGLRAASIRPAFIATWASAFRQLRTGDWLAVVARRSVTVARAGPRNWWSPSLRPDLIRTFSIPSASSLPDGVVGGLGWLAQAIRLEALRQDLAVPQRVVLCGLPLPAPAQSQAKPSMRGVDPIRFDRLQEVAA